MSAPSSDVEQPDTEGELSRLATYFNSQVQHELRPFLDSGEVEVAWQAPSAEIRQKKTKISGGPLLAMPGEHSPAHLRVPLDGRHQHSVEFVAGGPAVLPAHSWELTAGAGVHSWELTAPASWEGTFHTPLEEELTDEPASLPEMAREGTFQDPLEKSCPLIDLCTQPEGPPTGLHVQPEVMHLCTDELTDICFFLCAVIPDSQIPKFPSSQPCLQPQDKETPFA